MYLTLVFLAASVLPILVMIPLIIKRVSPYRVVLEGIIGGAVGATFVIILAAASGKGVYAEMEQIIDYMAKSLANNPSLTEAMNTSGATEAERIEQFTKIYEAAANLIPSSVVINSAIWAYIEYIILSKIIKPQGNAALAMPKFREFSIPRNAIIGLAVIYLLSWLITKGEIMPNDLLYININAIFNFTFCLQGMSVLFMFCYKKSAPKIIAIIIILFFMASWYGKLLLLILGITDIIFGIKGKLR